MKQRCDEDAAMFYVSRGLQWSLPLQEAEALALAGANMSATNLCQNPTIIIISSRYSVLKKRKKNILAQREGRFKGINIYFQIDQMESVHIFTGHKLFMNESLLLYIINKIGYPIEQVLVNFIAL